MLGTKRRLGGDVDQLAFREGRVLRKWLPNLTSEVWASPESVTDLESADEESAPDPILRTSDGYAAWMCSCKRKHRVLFCESPRDTDGLACPLCGDMPPAGEAA